MFDAIIRGTVELVRLIKKVLTKLFWLSLGLAALGGFIWGAVTLYSIISLKLFVVIGIIVIVLLMLGLERGASYYD